MTTLWQKRFGAAMSGKMFSFTQSYSFDHKLFDYDAAVNKAWARALCRLSILSAQELCSIEKALDKISGDFHKGSLMQEGFASKEEDVHSLIENQLTEMLGDTGRKIHTGKSRNDQVATDMRLYVKDACWRIVSLLEGLSAEIAGLASRNEELLMPGYTHLQHAQPVLAAHHLLAHAERLWRDRGRILNTMDQADEMPLGSGPLAGAMAAVDREFLRRELGFKRLSANSMDAVSDRDFVLSLLADISIIGIHLSSIAEELVLWSSKEFSFIEMPSEACTGSSIMPHKKNPDFAELMRGKTGRFIGHFTGLCVTLKGLPLSYNRDLQEDKEPLFDAVEQVCSALELGAHVICGVKFKKDRLASLLEEDHLYMTDVAFYLVGKGVPFRTAYETVAAIVAYMEKKKKDFRSLTDKELNSFSSHLNAGVLDLCSPLSSVRAKKTAGSTSPVSVAKQFKTWKKRLEGRGRE